MVDERGEQEQKGIVAEREARQLIVQCGGRIWASATMKTMKVYAAATVCTNKLKWFLYAHAGWRATQPACSDGEPDNRKEPGSRRHCGRMPDQGKGNRSTVSCSWGGGGGGGGEGGGGFHPK